MAVTRALKLVVAAAAGAVLVAAGARWAKDHPGLAASFIAAGQCLVMWLVADELFPAASRRLTTGLKLAGVAAIGVGLAVAWLGV